jgi:hypothetical protein
MKTVTFYLQQDRVVYLLDGAQSRKQGVLQIKEAEVFLSENSPDILNVILPKPDIFFRKIEFPFTNRKNIKLVLPQEMENVLPEKPESYYYFFEFSYAVKGKTTVNVYAVREADHDFWKNLAQKYNSKLFFYFDTLLFHLFLRQQTAEKNYIGIYGIHDYLLINLTKDSINAGSYSSYFKGSEAVVIKELISDVLVRNDLQIFVFAEESIREKIDAPAEKIRDIKFLPDVEKPFLFHNLLDTKIYRKPLQLRKLTSHKKAPVYNIILLSVFLVFSILLWSPYFHIPAKKRQFNEISDRMNKTFLSVCPEVKKIVDPLVQMKEKMMGQKSVGDIMSNYPSVLKMMAEVTAFFPEDVNASIDYFSVAGDTVTISGNTDSLQTLEIVKGKIEGSENFVVTNMGTVSFDAKNRVNFDITFRIKE